MACSQLACPGLLVGTWQNREPPRAGSLLGRMRHRRPGLWAALAGVMLTGACSKPHSMRVHSRPAAAHARCAAPAPASSARPPTSPVALEPEASILWFDEDGKKTSVWLDGAVERGRRPSVVIATASGLWEWRAESLEMRLDPTCGDAGGGSQTRVTLWRLDGSDQQIVVAPGAMDGESFRSYQHTVLPESSFGPYVFYRTTVVQASCDGMTLPSTQVNTWNVDEQRDAKLFDAALVTPAMREEAVRVLQQVSPDLQPTPDGVYFENVAAEYFNPTPVRLVLVFVLQGGYYAPRASIGWTSPPPLLAAPATVPASVVRWKQARPKADLRGVSIITSGAASARNAFLTR